VDAFAALKGKGISSRKVGLSTGPLTRAFAVCCAVSKKYEGDYQPYWYAFHPTWEEFLAEGKESYFILSCMDREEAYAIPYSWLRENKKNLNMTIGAKVILGTFLLILWRATASRLILPKLEQDITRSIPLQFWRRLESTRLLCGALDGQVIMRSVSL